MGNTSYKPTLGFYITFGILNLVTSIFSGYAVSTLWEWFVVPLGVPSIGLFHAIGLVVLGTVFTMGITQVLAILNMNTSENVSPEESYTRLNVVLGFVGIMLPAIALGSGYICKILM
jgi:hypothetical protein